MFKPLLYSTLLVALCAQVHAADLLESWRAARAHDAAFSAAGHALAAGQEKAQQARALLLPQVSLATAASLAQKNVLPGDPSATRSSAQGPHYGATLALLQPLYDANTAAAREQLQLQTKQAQLQYRVAEQELMLRVATAYFELLLAQENVRLVQAQQQAVARQLAQAEKTFSIGAGTQADTSEARARYDAIAASAIAVRNELELKQAAYQQMTQLDAQSLAPLSTAHVPPGPQPATLAPWLDQARSHSLAALAQAIELELAQSEVARYLSERSPSVALVANVGTQWDSNGPAHSAWLDRSNARSIGVQLSIPLYDGGNRSSQWREAVERAAQQGDALEAGVQAAQLATRQSFLGMQSGAAQVKALEQATRSSATLVASSIMGRDVGVRTTVDVLNAQQVHFQNLYNLQALRYQYLLSSLQLEASVGQLTQDQLASVNRWLSAAP